MAARSKWVERDKRFQAAIAHVMEQDSSSINDALESLLVAPTTSHTTTFNADGTITTVYAAPVGVTSVTTFNDDGSITEVFGAPVSKTRVTTFNPDGSISTEVTA